MQINALLKEKKNYGFFKSFDRFYLEAKLYNSPELKA